MENYDIRQNLGSGLYISTKKCTQTKCLIKEIYISHLKTPEVESIRNKVLLWSNLDHNHIARVEDSFETANSIFLVLEYCHGGTMKSLMNNRHGIHFPEDRVLDWFAQLCLAVKFIHDKNITHQNITTENVFLTKTGQIKLGNFGIVQSNACEDIIISYSPELYNNMLYTKKSDIWSLGCTLYEMLALKQAFAAKNMNAMFQKMMKCLYDPIPFTYSHNLKTILSSIIQLSPNQRPSIDGIIKQTFIMKRITRFVSEKDSNELQICTKKKITFKRVKSSGVLNNESQHSILRKTPVSVTSKPSSSSSTLKSVPIYNKPSHSVGRNFRSHDGKQITRYRNNLQSHKTSKQVNNNHHNASSIHQSKRISTGLAYNGGLELSHIEKRNQNVLSKKRYSLHSIQCQKLASSEKQMTKRSQSLDLTLTSDSKLIQRKVSLLTQKEIKRIYDSALTGDSGRVDYNYTEEKLTGSSKCMQFNFIEPTFADNSFNEVNNYVDYDMNSRRVSLNNLYQSCSEKRKNWDKNSRDIVNFLSNASLLPSSQQSIYERNNVTPKLTIPHKELSNLERSLSEPLCFGWKTPNNNKTQSSIFKSTSINGMEHEISISNSKLFNITYTKKGQNTKNEQISNYSSVCNKRNEIESHKNMHVSNSVKSFNADNQKETSLAVPKNKKMFNFSKILSKFERKPKIKFGSSTGTLKNNGYVGLPTTYALKSHDPSLQSTNIPTDKSNQHDNTSGMHMDSPSQTDLSMTASSNCSDTTQKTAFDIVQNVFKSALKNLQKDKRSSSKISSRIKQFGKSFQCDNSSIIRTNLHRTCDVNMVDNKGSDRVIITPITEKLRYFSETCGSPLLLTPIGSCSNQEDTPNTTNMEITCDSVISEAAELPDLQSVTPLNIIGGSPSKLNCQDVYGWIEEQREKLELSLGLTDFLENYKILVKALEDNSVTMKEAMEGVQANLMGNSSLAKDILELILYECMYMA